MKEIAKVGAEGASLVAWSQARGSSELEVSVELYNFLLRHLKTEENRERGREKRIFFCCWVFWCLKLVCQRSCLDEVPARVLGFVQNSGGAGPNDV